MDNECSTALNQYLTSQDVELQCVPPDLHLQNAAEKAIQTFKNHVIVGVCSVDKTFPMHLWYELLAPATLALNLLCTS
jgi:hypothetical protein